MSTAMVIANPATFEGSSHATDYDPSGYSEADYSQQSRGQDILSEFDRLTNQLGASAKDDATREFTKYLANRVADSINGQELTNDPTINQNFQRWSEVDRQGADTASGAYDGLLAIKDEMRAVLGRARLSSAQDSHALTGPLPQSWETPSGTSSEMSLVPRGRAVEEIDDDPSQGDEDTIDEIQDRLKQDLRIRGYTPHPSVYGQGDGSDSESMITNEPHSVQSTFIVPRSPANQAGLHSSNKSLLTQFPTGRLAQYIPGVPRPQFNRSQIGSELNDLMSNLPSGNQSRTTAGTGISASPFASDFQSQASNIFRALTEQMDKKRSDIVEVKDELPQGQGTISAGHASGFLENGAKRTVSYQSGASKDGTSYSYSSMTTTGPPSIASFA
ncbi:uncharacterized protein IL334_004652 [Kwoniella shivajii]|uniref:Uncharacterized protein n=1 Tax=Kwoniella shivajii TaxID=564305 RepID=A0ABZ1D1A9_9TREE|nr:hypothetical protein IL334_004652 [Kwoniella shivajii]